MIIDSYARSIHYKNIKDKIVILSDSYVQSCYQNLILSTKVFRAMDGIGCYFGADDGEVNLHEITRSEFPRSQLVTRSDIIGWVSEDEYEKMQVLGILQYE
jgi:hypothetical protein